MSARKNNSRRLLFGFPGLVAALVVLLSCFPGQRADAQAAGKKKIKAIAARLGGDVERTRFVTDLSEVVEYEVKVIPNPFRVIVDLPEVDFRFPPGLGREGRGLVKAYRYGQFDEGKSRIVLDVSAPVLVSRSFVIEPRQGQPARLVVDLAKTDMAGFVEIHAASVETAEEQVSRAAEIAALLRRMVDAAPSETVRPRAKPGSKRLGGKPVIVIDPGHGGVDPGAIGRGGTAEKSVTLAFSRALREKLEKSGRYEVHMTRNSDRFIRLRDRVRIARDRNADLFISVHADSIRSGRIRGSTVYTLSERASDKEAAALAAQENRADLIAGAALKSESTAVKGILIDLAQRETKNHSVHFARQLLRRIKRVSLLRTKPHRQAGFAVLTAPDVPSILVELGYLSNRRDENNLRSGAWRRKFAGAVVKAVDRYFSTDLAQRN